MSRKKKAIFSIIFAATISIITAIVWMFNNPTYTHFIPEHAKAVVRIDPSEIASFNQTSDILQDIFGFSPNGINLTSPIYLFITPNDLIGLTAPLSNANAFDTAIRELVKIKSASDLGKSDGRHWAWISSGWMLGWSTKDILVLGPGVAAEGDMLKQTMRRMAKTSTSFENTETFDKLCNMRGAIRLFADISTLPTPYGLLFKLNLPSNLPSESVSLFAAIDIAHNGYMGNKITAECTLSGNTEDIRENIAKFEKSLCDIRPEIDIDGKHLFSLSTSASGQTFLKLLRTDGTLRSLLVGLNQTIDASRMLGSINGLLTLQIDSLDAEWNPTFCLKGQTTQCDLTADANYWMESVRNKSEVKLIQEDKTKFQLTAKGQTIHFGVDANQGILYFSSPSMRSYVEQSDKTTQREKSKEKILTYFTLNMEKLYAQPCLQKPDAAVTLLRKLLPATKRITYRAMRDGHSILTFE